MYRLISHCINQYFVKPHYILMNKAYSKAQLDVDCVIGKAKCVIDVHFLCSWMNKLKEYDSSNVRIGFYWVVGGLNGSVRRKNSIIEKNS